MKALYKYFLFNYSINNNFIILRIIKIQITHISKSKNLNIFIQKKYFQLFH